MQVDKQSRSARASLYQYIVMLGVAEVFLLVVALCAALFSLFQGGPLDGHDLIVATNAYCMVLLILTFCWSINANHAQHPYLNVAQYTLRIHGQR